METSEAARTVRRDRASKLGCKMERTRLCVPSCFLQSFCCDVWSFVCVLNCLDSSVFVSCWPFLSSTFVSSPSSSPPPLSPLRPPPLLTHLSSHLLVLFSIYYRYQTHTHSVGGEMLWNNTTHPFFLSFSLRPSVLSSFPLLSPDSVTSSSHFNYFPPIIILIFMPSVPLYSSPLQFYPSSSHSL